MTVSRAIPLLFIGGLILSGCQTSAGNCAGWRQPPKANDPVSLVQREEPISRYLVATDRFGKAQGCWK